MIKEGLMDATPSNKIIIRINEDSEGYQQVLFENGSLIVQCRSDRFWTNIGDISNVKIEKVMPVTSGNKVHTKYLLLK